MKRVTVFVALFLTLVLVGLAGLVALALGVPWASNTGSASPTGNLACSVKPACDVGEVEVLRMSSTSNAHAGTPAGSGYGYSVCCGEVCNLSTDCGAVYDTVLTLSAADNAHAAPDGSYATEVCLSVPYGVADCTYGPACGGGYECVATVSGGTNAHLADCDGVDDYATKVCCQVVGDCDNDGTLDPDDVDDDGDEFDDSVEDHVGTDPCDDCPDVLGTPGLCPGPSCDGDDAWPPDVTVDRVVDIFDALKFLDAFPSAEGSPNYSQRLDMKSSDGVIDIFDALTFLDYFPSACTP